MTEKTVQIDADSLEEARKKLAAQVSGDIVVISTEIVQNPIPKTTVKGVADTVKEAFDRVRGDLPAGVEVIEQKELFQSAGRTLDVKAFDEQAARSQAKAAMSDTAMIVEIRLKTPGKKGILGLGKKPNVYEVILDQPAVVEVTYKRVARIRATLSTAPEPWTSLLEVIVGDRDVTDRSRAYVQLREAFVIAEWEASPGIGIGPRPTEMKEYDYRVKELAFAEAAAMLPSAIRPRAEFRLLADAIAHPELRNRVAAVKALGELRSHAAVPVLSQMLLDWLHYESLTDSGDSLRGPAAQALAKIADPKTMDLLVASIELDRLNVYPESVIDRGKSIRAGVADAGTDFAKEVLERHRRGEIDQTLVYDLFVAASDSARYFKFVPVEHHRSVGPVFEQRSFSFMAEQAQKQLASLKPDEA